MAVECLLLLEDGTGYLLFEDGSGDLLLEACVTAPCAYLLESGDGVILLEDGGVLLPEGCAPVSGFPLGGWIEPFPLIDDDIEAVVLALVLARRRRRLTVG